MNRFGLLVIFVCAVGSGTAAAMPLNVGFEDGVLAPWFQDREFPSGAFEAWNVTSAQANSGTFSATSTNNIEIRQNFAGVSTDDILEVSFYALHEGAGDAMFVELFYGDATSSSTVVDVAEGSWLQVDVTSILAPSKVLTGFSLFGNSAGCPGVDCTRTYIDDLLVRTDAVEEPTPAPVPATLLLMGLGLLGLGLRRNR